MGFFDRFRKRVKEVVDDTDLDALTAEEGSEEAAQITTETTPSVEEEGEDVTEVQAPIEQPTSPEDDDWDDEPEPSVECPLGDFFATGWGGGGEVSSLPVCVNPKGGLNSYWLMPFRRQARITLENQNDCPIGVFYQIDYTLTDVPEDAAYFHAQFRRVNPVSYKDVYTVLDGVRGQGQFVGVYMCWGSNMSGWWGEGEAKFYIDGDGEYPTICGTGTEDYFCGAAGFGHNGKYTEFNTPYVGMAQVINPHENHDYFGKSQNKMRFGLYRWHIVDPVRFEEDFRMTIQALGWNGKMVPLEDDLASTAFWYQKEPHTPFPVLPDKQYLAID